MAGDREAQSTGRAHAGTSRRRRFHGSVLDRESSTPLAHGELALVRIEQRFAIARVALTTAELGTNTRVKLVKD